MIGLHTIASLSLILALNYFGSLYQSDDAMEFLPFLLVALEGGDLQYISLLNVDVKDTLKLLKEGHGVPPFRAWLSISNVVKELEVDFLNKGVEKSSLNAVRQRANFAQSLLDFRRIALPLPESERETRDFMKQALEGKLEYFLGAKRRGEEDVSFSFPSLAKMDRIVGELVEEGKLLGYKKENGKMKFKPESESLWPESDMWNFARENIQLLRLYSTHVTPILNLHLSLLERRKKEVKGFGSFLNAFGVGFPTSGSSKSASVGETVDGEEVEEVSISGSLEVSRRRSIAVTLGRYFGLGERRREHLQSFHLDFDPLEIRGKLPFLWSVVKEANLKAAQGGK